MNEKIKELKKVCKEMAATIKSAKSEYRTRREIRPIITVNEASRMRMALNKKQWEYRHHHIAYCELRGRLISQIEPKVREGNQSLRSLIESIKLQYGDSHE